MLSADILHALFCLQTLADFPETFFAKIKFEHIVIFFLCSPYKFDA